MRNAMHNAMPTPLASVAVNVAAAFGLAACATSPAPPAAGEFQCVAEAGAWAVGNDVTADMVAKIRTDTHSRTVRVLRPGQPATMDFRGDRVNVMLDARDKVERVTCG
jgi:hypothetical protein